ncbi:ParA family protein [Roseomonas sp. KE0001]|uniref:ParA family protein n=1 Tax=Roseomonas sp. KE0001 TaxID=2479201 RepID=UPI0018DFCF68|nr:ParA family protein [Roseomonas sp. KE0001]MBI0436057.1 plasmid partitioning-family protein [Roseomonas sp. KE0001]
MRIYALISQKGGAGKSMLARQLAVLAGESGRSLLIDRDPQATSGKWWQRRQMLQPTPAEPDLLDLGNTSLTMAAKALGRQEGSVFIDTRPAVTEPEAEAARVANLVIVPVRPSSDDLEAVGETLRILRRLDRRAVLVINAAKNEMRARDAKAALSRYPVPVCPIHVGDRAIYLDASLEGRGVGEMKGAAARDAHAELRAIWNWIQDTAHDPD